MNTNNPEASSEKRKPLQRDGATIYTAILLEHEVMDFMADSPESGVFWMTAHLLAAKLCDGGRIKGAGSLSDRGWARLGVLHYSALTKGKNSPLWQWDGDDLIILHYDQSGETKYRNRVNGGRETGQSNAGKTRSKETPAKPKSGRGEERGSTPNDNAGYLNRDPANLNGTEPTSRQRS